MGKVLRFSNFTHKKSAVFGHFFIRDFPVCHNHRVSIIEAVLSDSDWLLEADPITDPETLSNLILTSPRVAPKGIG